MDSLLAQWEIFTDVDLLALISKHIDNQWLRRTYKYICTFESIVCCNDELSLPMSRVGCLLKDTEHSILFPENSQILLKMSVNPILLTFHVSEFFK